MVYFMDNFNLILLLFIPAVYCATRISYISPHYGSLNGATKITIWGSEFAANQFNFGDDSDLGNRVELVSETRNYECDVLRDESITERIVCYTRRMPEDNYYVRITIDGKPVPESAHCNCNGFCWNCLFRPKWGNTPSIHSIQPKTALPGSIITIHGNIYTTLYGTNIEVDEHGRTRRIKRVYVGGSKCELRDPDAPDEPEINDELYGIALNNGGRSNYGHFKCKVEGSFVDLPVVMTDERPMFVEGRHHKKMQCMQFGERAYCRKLISALPQRLYIRACGSGRTMSTYIQLFVDINDIITGTGPIHHIESNCPCAVG